MRGRVRHFYEYLKWPLACVCALSITTTLFAQSGTRSASPTGSSTRTAPAVVAAPRTQASSPFFPPVDQGLRLPVAIQGFCVVSLRDRQKWLDGLEAFQQLFDGKLYWFATRREREIFASNPQRYVPALAGDCVVTFAQRGERRGGNPRYGILHKRRLYFFASEEELKTFRANPVKYADADLAAGGNCLVSRIDNRRELEGLPETTVIVSGLRYRFAGLHQQRIFLSDMERYGVEEPELVGVDSGSGSRFASALPLRRSQGVSGLPDSAKAKAASKAPIVIKNKAMGGYSPVSIRDKGVWAEGDPKFHVVFDGFTYLMVNDEEKALFQKSPDIYIPALAGHCVVTDVDENRLVKGTIYHAAHHEGEDRLFLFAGPEQKERFNADPGPYLKADIAADGLCVVSLVDDRAEVAGLPEFVTWHKGKRYFFASAEKQAKFPTNVELYELYQEQ